MICTPVKVWGFAKFSRYLSRSLVHSSKTLVVLGVETSCDDTATAIVNSNGKVLSETKFSQQNIHLRYGGITPPRAQNLHRENIENAVAETFKKAGATCKDMTAIAVTNRPGLPLSLSVGVRYARYLARQSGTPLIPIHHMEAHATIARMTNTIPYPFLCLLISGGHGQLAVARNVNEFLLLGETLDDAPGEIFDKVARRLKLQYIPKYENMSGGAAIELAAEEATNKGRYDFPVPLARYKDCQFSFAGVKNTAFRCIMKEERKHECKPDEIIPHYKDFCASLLHAVARHISYRTQRAIEYCDLKNLAPKNSSRYLVVSGGVACNDYIFISLEEMAKSYGYKIFRPLKQYCSDNGVMISWNAIERIMDDYSVLQQDLDQVNVFGKFPLGFNIVDDVKKAEIQCKWIKVNTFEQK